MNRRRNQPKPSPVPILAVLMIALFATCGGVFYVSCKNRQIEITREIDQIERNIEHRRLDIRTMEMRMDQLLNRFVIRKRLQEHGSGLRPISVAVVEEIRLESETDRSVASASP